MPGQGGHQGVTRGLGLAVDAQRAERLVFGVLFFGAVEHVVGGYVHQGNAVFPGHLDQP